MNAGQFLSDRQLTADTAREFGLGFYDINGIVFGSTFPEEAKQHLTARYHNSIIFPVYSLHSNVEGIVVRHFSGNVKYDSPYNFKKNQYLYGLHKAVPHLVNSGWAVLVEGPVDMLSLYQAGVKNTVALFGTHLTYNQFCLLRRFVDNWLIVLDGDSAGMTAARTIQKFGMKNQIYSRILRLPDQNDPDEFIRKQGLEGWHRLCQAQSIPVLRQGSILGSSST